MKLKGEKIGTIEEDKGTQGRRESYRSREAGCLEVASCNLSKLQVHISIPRSSRSSSTHCFCAACFATHCTFSFGMTETCLSKSSIGSCLVELKTGGKIGRIEVTSLFWM